MKIWVLLTFGGYYENRRPSVDSERSRSRAVTCEVWASELLHISCRVETNFKSCFAFVGHGFWLDCCRADAGGHFGRQVRCIRSHFFCRIGSWPLPVHLDPCVRSHPRADMARSALSTFKGVDAFGKTMDDVKVKTRTGAMCASAFKTRVLILRLLTIISLAIIFKFTTFEFFDYRRINHDPSMVVDKSRGEKVTVDLNVTRFGRDLAEGVRGKTVEGAQVTHGVQVRRSRIPGRTYTYTLRRACRACSSTTRSRRCASYMPRPASRSPTL